MTNHWIENTAIGQTLDDVARTRLGDLRPMDAPQGFTLFSPGASCAGFPLVLAGVARVSLSGESGRGLVLYRIGVGDVCIQSTLCLLGGQAYGAEARAETPMRLVLVPPARFDGLIAQSSSFRTFVFARFGQRLQEVTQILEEVAFSTLDMRLARVLIARAGAGASIHATHQQLADEIGAVREAVTRRLSFLGRAGLVSMMRGVVTINDKAALLEMSGRYAGDERSPPPN